ncbi:multinuclear nonheme iron-dependent oxidase [Streptomyces lavendulae]|uniref:multinuclear nonheme iron-dependent oxidase n=1 Tax=Streptomyces lavendulae TaxID=1914 RepID=UPI003806D8DC
MKPMARLGVGIGWRPEIAEAVERLGHLDWVEVVAENVCPGHLPESLLRLRERGVRVVPHGVSLGLGGADRPDPAKLAALGERAVALGAPLVTEHIAFVRTSSPVLEAGHLLPVPRTRDALDVLCENVRIAQDALPVPLALENIAALVSWPGEELTEARFLTELVERTGVRLLVDVANLHTNRVNRGEDPAAVLDGIPLEALAYVHVAGGVERDGVWHDTHAHPVPPVVLDVLAALRDRVDPPGVLLERDDDFPAESELAAELTRIREVVTVTGADGTGPAGVVPAGTELPCDAGGIPGAGVRAAAEAAPRAQDPEGARDADGSDGETGVRGGAALDGARTRVGIGQAALLSALVAGTPVPEGFDRQRIRVQARALAAKRASVVAKVAPELPGILGGPGPFREAFLGYARRRPMTSGYRRDALDFAEHLLIQDLPADPAARRRLTAWWRDRAGARPPGRLVRWARALTGRAS